MGVGAGLNQIGGFSARVDSYASVLIAVGLLVLSVVVITGIWPKTVPEPSARGARPGPRRPLPPGSRYFLAGVSVLAALCLLCLARGLGKLATGTGRGARVGRRVYGAVTVADAAAGVVRAFRS